MKTKTAFYTLIITIFLCLSSKVKANVLNVNNTLTSSESGSLNHALSLAVSGDTIHFDEALKTDTIELDSSIVIDKNITIEGNDITLSGNNATRIMMVNNGALLFIYDTKFILGKAVNGGAIYNNGIVVVERCTFDKNLSDAPIGTVSCGGAVYNTNSFTAKSSIFSNNKAQSHDEMAFGGAYGTTLDNTLTLLSEFAFCSFVNNTATAENISYSSYYYSAGGGLFLNNDNYNSNVKLIANILQGNTSFYYYGTTGDFMLVNGGMEVILYNALEGSSRWVYAISDLYPETVTDYGYYYSWESSSNKYGSYMLVLDNNVYRIPQYSASGPIGIYTVKSSNYVMELPKKDILGDVLDYDLDLNAGACQSLSSLVLFNLSQTTGGVITANISNGSYVNAGSEVSLTATPALGYKLIGWNLNGTKNQDKTATIKVYPMVNYTASAIFQYEDTLVTNASGGTSAGSLAYVISKCVGGETIVFADELANDTIVLANTITIGRTITIQGNGVTLSGNNLRRILKTTQPIRVNHVNFIRGAATYGGAIACDNGYNELYFTNCIFDSNKATDATLGGAAIKGGKPRLTACQFSNNVSAGKAGGVWGSYIIATACTFVNNSSTIGGGAIYEDAPNQNHSMQLTANVFQNNYNSSTMFTTDITMNARSFTSYGYNVHSGSHYAGTTYNPLAAEWESSDKIITDPFLVEDNGIYKVWNTTSNTAMNLLPANLTITGATLPSKDILGDTIYYTQKTQAGACQSLITKPLLLVTITQATKGIIKASEFIGNKRLVEANAEITFTATPSSEYMFYRWIVDGKDTVTTIPNIKLKITKATTISAKFQYTNPIVTSNSGTNVAGSLINVYNKCLGDEIIRFSDDLANDTIIFPSTFTLAKSITIKGNGITFSGNGLVRILIISYDADITISCVKFINGYIANDGGAAIFNGGNLTLSSCEFRNNSAKSGSGYGGAAIRAACLSLKLIHCSFINNRLIPTGTLEEKKTGGAIHNLNNNTVMFACVFQNNQAINQSTTNDIDGKFTSLGYNVFTTTLSNQIATDKVSLVPSLIFDDGVYKVSNDSNCPAKGLIPANITISGINLPENDVLNAEIDRSTTTHAGSCQSTTENIQVFMNQTTGGTITCDSFTGTDAVFTPSQLAQITFTQQAAIGYQFEKWVINGKDSVNTDASISVPLKSVTISAVFRFIDTQVTTKVFNINTKGSLPYIIARCENNATITFADALASETIVFGSTITVNDKSLTIVGNGITFSGSNARRILYVAGSRTLVLENLKFINGRTSGYDSDGAAIYSFSRLIVKRCLFKGNQNVQASCNNALGGAIRLKNTGYFEACVFDSNLAQASGKGAGCGAGICANDVSVVNCTFVNNFTTAASGVYNVSSGCAVFATGELYLAGNIFQDNENTFAADSAKVVFGTPLVSEGYNILDNGFLASQWTSTDILTIDSIVSEVDYLPVQSSTNPIFGFIPANTQFSTIVMPTKDYIGNNIDYSKAFCSGACQSELMPVSVINTKDDSSITVYPNPAKNFIIINLKEEEESDISVQLFSIDGKSVYKDKIKDKSFTINSSNFLTGSYVLLISTKNNIYRKKIIIKK